MAPVRTLIIDDEPLARELLETYLRRLPGFTVVGTCNNALEAFEILGRESVDLLLLDIDMPEISGMDFLKTLKAPPHVIFTTAYAEYAVESYEHRAIDYLLKPVTFDRFIKAIHKLPDALAPPGKLAETALGSKFFFVKSEGKMIRVDPEQLWFVEGYKNYIRLWTGQEKIIVHSTMKHIEACFQPYPLFIRINKSYLVNLKYVSEVDGNCVRIMTETLVIGLTYREALRQLFEQHRML